MKLHNNRTKFNNDVLKFFKSNGYISAPEYFILNYTVTINSEIDNLATYFDNSVITCGCLPLIYIDKSIEFLKMCKWIHEIINNLTFNKINIVYYILNIGQNNVLRLRTGKPFDEKSLFSISNHIRKINGKSSMTLNKIG